SSPPRAHGRRYRPLSGATALLLLATQGPRVRRRQCADRRERERADRRAAGAPGARAPPPAREGGQDREARRAAANGARPRGAPRAARAAGRRAPILLGSSSGARPRDGRPRGSALVILRSARPVVVLLALGTAPAWGGVADTPLPTFADAQPAQRIATF